MGSNRGGGPPFTGLELAFAESGCPGLRGFPYREVKEGKKMTDESSVGDSGHNTRVLSGPAIMPIGLGFDHSTTWPLPIIALDLNVAWGALEAPPLRRIQER